MQIECGKCGQNIPVVHTTLGVDEALCPFCCLKCIPNAYYSIETVYNLRFKLVSHSFPESKQKCRSSPQVWILFDTTITVICYMHLRVPRHHTYCLLGNCDVIARGSPCQRAEWYMLSTFQVVMNHANTK